MLDLSEWKNPSSKYRVNNNVHFLPKDKEKFIKLHKEYGFSGMLVNVPFSNGFTKNADNLNDFKETVDLLRKTGTEYWIYDDKDYPSGRCAEEVLENRPDLRAKVVYMRKYESFYRPLKFTYSIDGISDGIAFAAKYKVKYTEADAEVLIDTFETVSHNEKSIEVDLKEREIIYIYVVKDAYEGCPATHSIADRNYYVNLLSEEATDRFLNFAYKRVANIKDNPFKDCTAVFTDEPALESIYVRRYRANNYAPIPYEKNFIDKFNSYYGYDLKKNFYKLFEDAGDDYPKIRTDFYSLIAQVFASNYTKKLNDFCVANGTVLSGHYFGEERLVEHVMCYGNLVEVLMSSGYAGMDAIQCTPEDNFYNVPKFFEMVARKKKQNGYMVEFCPFCNKEVFDSNPFENAIGTLGVLAMFGARKVNTYFRPNFSEYFSEDEKTIVKGAMNKTQSQYFNEYFARICSLLEGSSAEYDNYVYFAIEDVQAKFAPRICAEYRNDCYLSSYDVSADKLAELMRKGVSYTFFDLEELKEGISAKRIIVPKIHFISDDTVKLLREKERNGCKVYFIENVPNTVSGKGKINFGERVEYESLREIMREDGDFGVEFEEKETIAQKYGKYYAVYNNNKQDVVVRISKKLTVYDPDAGKIIKSEPGDEVRIKSYRVMLFEKR